MAGFGVIRDISRELRRQVFEALETAADVDFGLDGVLARLSLQDHLSAQRSNGLRAMIQRIRETATAAA